MEKKEEKPKKKEENKKEDKTKKETKKEEPKKKLTKKEKEAKEKEKAKKKLKNIKIEKKPKQEKKEKTNIVKRIISSYAFLYSTLAILAVVVVVLGVLVNNQKKIEDQEADLVLPIIYENTQNELKVDMPKLYKKGEYILKITNFHGKQVNKEKIAYNITIKNNSDSKIKVVKNDGKDNLMVDQVATTIDDGSLKSITKQADKYTITITGEKPKNGDEITIQVRS